MQTEQILALLVAERDRLSRAIDALQSGVKRRGRPPRNSALQATTPAAAPARRRRGHMSAAQRKAQSERMKAFWAQRRKAKAKA